MKLNVTTNIYCRNGILSIRRRGFTQRYNLNRMNALKSTRLMSVINSIEDADYFVHVDGWNIDYYQPVDIKTLMNISGLIFNQ